MFGYIAIYKSQKHELYAEDLYKAQRQAATYFKAKKSYDVSVYLCEKDGKQVETTFC